MSGHRPGSVWECADIPGRWEIWDRAGDGPGCYFLGPRNDEARATGCSWVVFRIKKSRDLGLPTPELIRTNPHKPEYFKEKK